MKVRKIVTIDVEYDTDYIEEVYWRELVENQLGQYGKVNKVDVGTVPLDYEGE
jgi:hypothetical protein